MKKILSFIVIFALVFSLSVSPVAQGTQMASSFSVTQATPQGVLDSVSIDKISGWAWNPDSPNESIQIHIYVTNVETQQNWVFIDVANVFRQDLLNAGYGNGYHGFSYSINWAPFPAGTYNIVVYAIGGGNPALGGCPKSYIVRDLDGNVDYASAQGVGGWAWKPDAPNTPIQVHVYIRKLNNTVVQTHFLDANLYRADLANMGYGNGYHGFAKSIDWAALPEEQLKVEIYVVDGSGQNPCMYNTIYENRKPIYMVGMNIECGEEPPYHYHDMTAWVDNETTPHFIGIGCSSFHKEEGANCTTLRDWIKASSFCVVNTHGYSEGVQCINNGAISYLTSSMIETLPNDYFNTTRCVLLSACSTGDGGANNQDNLVNTLHRKGVWTVVGFEDSIWYSCTNNALVTNYGSCLWNKRFVRALSENENIITAIDQALLAVYQQDEWFCGLDSFYVAGDVMQVVEH